MPVPGNPNNPDGVNGFNRFAPEQPYGEATNQKRLQQGAPLASSPVSVGALNAPRRTKQQATQPQQQAAPPLLPVAPPSSPAFTDLWQQIAATPGASPLVISLAEKALAGE